MNPMQTINDVNFLRRLFRDFCLRSTSSRNATRVLRSMHVEVHHVTPHVLNLHVCDGEGPLIEMAWSFGEARPVRMLSINKALLEADQDELTRFVKRFLRKHDVINSKGLSTRKATA